MPQGLVSPEDTVADIDSARDQLLARRALAIAEFDSRVAELDELAEAVAAGTIEFRAAQAKIRRLLADRATATPVQAGRTRIGLQAPANPGSAPTPQRMPTTTSGTNHVGQVSTALARAVGDIESHMVRVLTHRDADLEESRMELALLLWMRRGLNPHLGALPEDPALLDNVAEFVGQAQRSLADLARDEDRRLRQLASFARAMASELAAVGGEATPVKERAKKANRLLAEDAPKTDAARKEILLAFSDARKLLEENKKDPRSLIDGIL